MRAVARPLEGKRAFDQNADAARFPGVHFPVARFRFAPKPSQEFPAEMRLALLLLPVRAAVRAVRREGFGGKIAFGEAGEFVRVPRRVGGVSAEPKRGGERAVDEICLLDTIYFLMG